MASELKQSQLVLNEVEELQKVIKTKKLPSFWNVFQFLYRFTMYYRDLGYNDTEIVGMAVEWLIDSKTDYEIDAVCDLIASVPNQSDKKYRQLRELPNTIIFYKEELDTLKSIESRQAQRLYFSMLVACKVQEIKGSKNPNHIYSDLGSVCRLGEMNTCKLNDALIELGFKHKVIKAPLDANYVEVKMGGTDTVHEINDFEPSKVKHYFIELFGEYEPIEKPVILLDYWGEEEPQLFKSRQECARELGIPQSNIVKSLKPWTYTTNKRATLGYRDYMFIDASRKEDETDKAYNIRMYLEKELRYLVKSYYIKVKQGKMKVGKPIVIEYETVEELVESINSKSAK